MKSKKKIIRVTTVPISLSNLLKGQLKYMSKYYSMIAISSPGKILDNYSKEEGISTESVVMTRKISPFKDLMAVYKLYKIFRREKPFIVHSHTPKAGTASMIAAKLAGVPNRLHTIAGLPLVEATGLKKNILFFVEKVTYYCATKIYPNSYGLKEIILKNKFTTSDKLHIIGNGSSNGIDTSYFNSQLITQKEKSKLKSKLNIKDSDLVFIYVGRLVKDKGINELVGAFKNIAASNSNAKLLMVGMFEKELDPLAQETINEIKTNPNIIAVGWKDDVRPYFSISNVLVFPSYREGFPNVVMQAGAMGLYSIVSNINGCNEIIIDGKNGKIIPPKDEEALYLAMKKFCSMDFEQHPKKYRELIVSRYERVFVWQKIHEEYKQLELNNC